MKKISVIFPFYGNFDFDRPKMAIGSIKEQKGVAVEIVISGLSENKNAEKFFKKQGVKYIGSPLTKENNKDIFRPGKIRNIAIKKCSGEYIYSTDGDIVFPNKNYLHNLISLMDRTKTPLYRPPMRRLPLESFKEFREMVSLMGIFKSIKKLDFSKEFIVNTRTNKITMKEITYLDKSQTKKRVLYTESDWKKYKSNTDNKGQEPKFSTLEVHGGGTLFLKKQAEFIGGYSEKFVNWGQDDFDLQWKLENVYGIQKIPKKTKFEVIHLDHKREYFKKEQWKRNLRIQKNRREKKFDEILDTDREAYKKL